MQILLTTAEYNELLEQKKLHEFAQVEGLQELCTRIANTMPVTRRWAKDKPPTPWGCILDDETTPGYCDCCPVDQICPCQHKGWSK